MDKNLRKRRLRRIIWLLVLAIAVVVVCLAVLDHPHPDAHLEKIGNVHFETSCSSAAGPNFDRALALLHSFEFTPAIDAFHAVLKDDPNCPIAYWGIALSQWGNPFAGHRPPEVLRQATGNIQKGVALGPKTQREKDYLSSVAELYRNADSVSERARMLYYETAMERLAGKYTNDSEAQIFYALALAQAAQPEDKTYAKQLRAASILDKAIEKQPDHPGATQ